MNIPLLLHLIILFVLPFIFFLGNPIIQNYLIRKDILLVLIFILIVYWSNKKNKIYLILINLFLIIGLLSHEIIAFFSFPILLLVFYNKFENKKLEKKIALKSLIIACLILIPCIIVFLFVSYFHGSEKIASDIWNSWSTIKFPNDNHSIIPTDEVSALTWTAKDAIMISLRNFLNFDGGLYAPLILFLSIASVYYVLTNINKINFKIFNIINHKDFNKAYLSDILVFQLFSLIPMFIICCDYSRLIFFWVTSSFGFYLLIPSELFIKFFPSIIRKISNSITSFFDYIFPTSRGAIFILCLIIGYSPYNWDFLTSINSNSLIMTLQFISLIIKSIFYTIFSNLHIFSSFLKHLSFNYN